MKQASRIYGIISKSEMKAVGREHFWRFKTLIVLRAVNVSGWTERKHMLQVHGVGKVTMTATRWRTSKFSNRIWFFELCVYDILDVDDDKNVSYYFDGEGAVTPCQETGNVWGPNKGLNAVATGAECDRKESRTVKSEIGPTGTRAV